MCKYKWFAMANHFTQKPILKRIKMMKKKNENRWTGVKIILFVPALILLLQAFARPEIKSDKLHNAKIQQINYNYSSDIINSEGEVKKAEPSSILNIRINKDGKLLIGKYSSSDNNEGNKYILWGDEISLEELKELISKKRQQLEETNKELNTRHELITSVIAEQGVKESEVKQLKEALRESKAQHINYRTIK